LGSVTPPVPRLLAIMGSGETSPTMTSVHRDLFARLGPPPVPAVLLDTPVGFQENADEIASRAVAYFRTSVGRDVVVASYRSAEAADAVEYETMLALLRTARYVFSGPGSPSYALQQWAGTAVPALLAEKLRSGGCITFASAAAVTLGAFALPVYEIYKVGQAPHWLEGLDVLAEAGLRAVVVPHFDNAEGRTHDTRYCYMGERRLSALESMLPDDTFVLGVDEHTVCVIDLDEAAATVRGRGAVTVRRRGVMTRFPPGPPVPLAAIRQAGLVGASSEDRPETVAPVPRRADRASHRPDAGRLEAEFGSAVEAGNLQAAVKAGLELEVLVSEGSPAAPDVGDRGEARAALRSMLVRLGRAAEEGTRDPGPSVAPLVEALLAARDRARAERRWADADAIRADLAAAGIEVRDTPGGSEWHLAPLA
jgi:cyanophycinase-like exopeptidase